MQPWHRWREPLAIVLLVALALMLVLRAVAAWAWPRRRAPRVGCYGSLPGGDDLLLLATAGAVLWCTTAGAGTPEPGDEPAPATSPHAWPIAVAGLVVVGLTVLGWLLLSAGERGGA